MLAEERLRRYEALIAAARAFLRDLDDLEDATNKLHDSFRETDQVARYPKVGAAVEADVCR